MKFLGKLQSTAKHIYLLIDLFSIVPEGQFWTPLTWSRVKRSEVLFFCDHVTLRVTWTIGFFLSCIYEWKGLKAIRAESYMDEIWKDG